VSVLLDTHTLVWYVLGDSHLNIAAESAILDPANEVLISPASYWEIAIKIGLGKYVLNRPYDDFIDLCLNRYRFRILAIEPKHTSRLISLTRIKDHKDPFDRLLVAQALVEGIPIVSNDQNLDPYGVTRIW
jgi:PIN domain nuclease of toxin-antitoxin system